MDKNLIELIDKVRLLVAWKVSNCVQQENGQLSSMDAFTLESLDALGQPTIGKFASFIGISQPNASYKVQSLMKKGYIKRIPSETDKRECKIELNDKYKKANKSYDEHLANVVKDTLKGFSKEEVQLLDKMLEKLNSELSEMIEQ